MKPICIKRIYDEPAATDGYRILVDRLWPRGVSKEKAQLDEWDKEIAPSTLLRKWFNHEAPHFKEFSVRYREELLLKEEDLKRIRTLAKSTTITLLYGAKDQKLNQAVVLKNILEESPHSS